MDAFDADVLIYAAVPGHPLGRRVAALVTLVVLSRARWPKHSTPGARTAKIC
jgi:hypothetical protein